MPMTSKQETSDRHADEPLIGDIEDAARRLAGVAVITPLLESAALNERLGGRLLVKAEPLQRTGSFKFRGAYNFMSRLGDAARRCGVMTYSSGNHGQAVAAAAKLLGMPALILMPTDAPAIKVRNTKAYGAEVMHYDRYADDRERLGAALVAERGYTLVPPFDHGLIIAGQGTTGLEIAEQAAHIGAEPDAVLVCCGGGGLVAGVALADKRRSPIQRCGCPLDLRFLAIADARRADFPDQPATAGRWAGRQRRRSPSGDGNRLRRLQAGAGARRSRRPCGRGRGQDRHRRSDRRRRLLRGQCGLRTFHKRTGEPGLTIARYSFVRAPPCGRPAA
jgi:hypothetical protein